MRLSEIKGKRQLDVIADVMELCDAIAERHDVTGLFDAIRTSDGTARGQILAMCKLAPILRDPDIQDRVVAVIASAKGMDPQEVADECDILSEAMEFLTSDAAMLGFLDSTDQPQA